MRRTVLSQKTVRQGKVHSKDSKASSRKLASTIDGFHSYLSSVSIGCNGFDFAWLLEQQQLLSRLGSRLGEQPQEGFKIKLRSCQSILQNIRGKIMQTRLNSIDVPMVDSAYHNTSCEARLRHRTVPANNSVEKLKQTAPAKQMIQRKHQEDRTPINEVVSDCQCRSNTLERESKEGTFRKFKPDSMSHRFENMIEAEQESVRNLFSLNRTLQVKLSEALYEQTRSQEHTRRLQAKVAELDLIKSEFVRQQELNQQLQLRITAMSKQNQLSQTESVRMQACLKTFQQEVESSKAHNTKLSKENEYLIKQANKQSDTIASLSEKIVELEQQLCRLDTSRDVAIANSKHREVEQKEAIIRQLIYQKENYSDGYSQLRKQKTEHLETIKRLQTSNQQLRQEIDTLQKKCDSLKEQLEEVQEDKLKLEQRLSTVEQENQDLGCSVKDLRLELRENRLELRTAEQKAEMFQERYYKLRQNSTEEEQLVRTLTQKELSRSSKIITDRSRPNTHEKSTEREDQGRRIKALTDLKVLVKNHRLNISSGLR